MSAIKTLNANAEVARAEEALQINSMSAQGLKSVLSPCFGPRGSLKMIVDGAGQISLTKSGLTLLKNMHITSATANLISNACVAQNGTCSDGILSNIILIGELLRLSEAIINEGVHPRLLTEGLELAKQHCHKVLEEIAQVQNFDRELLTNVAKTSLATKLPAQLVDNLSSIVTDAVQCLRSEDGKPIDLFMVEIMEMQHKLGSESRFVNGIVMDHGPRHPDMPKHVKNAYILTCNVSLEYEKTEVNSGFFYSTSDERDRMVDGERRFIDNRVRKIIELKNQVCDTPDKSFVLINQKGIDPPSLDMLAKAGIFALRRAKRRNMERLTLACGGHALNSVDELTPDCLGWAGAVYEQTLGEEKYTFVEECVNPASCTILLKGPNKHTLTQMLDAVKAGLRALVNAIEDTRLVPGAGAYEVACHGSLMKYKDSVKGRARLGVEAFANALLSIPKVLAINSGFDAQETIVKLQEEYLNGNIIGLDIHTGEPISPADEGIWDSYRVKKQLITSCNIIASNLLLVDEIMRAGLTSLKPQKQ